MRINRKSVLAALIAFAALASSARADFQFVAAPSALPPSATVTLARHDVDQRATRQVLSAQTEADGSFSLQSTEEAGIFVLTVETAPKLTLAVADGETVELALEQGNLQAKGSPGTEILQAYESFRKESLARLVYPTRNDIRNAKSRNATEQEIEKLTQAEVDAYQEHLKELNDFVIQNAGPTMALYGSSLRLDGDYRLHELAKLVDSFAQRHGDIEATRSLKNRIQIARNVALGSLAPELAATNLAGENASLSQHRGRYVLVDFWASWCPPCRLENKHYAQLVQQADSDRFTIFAVNLDTNEKAWSRAVARDQADWIHVSDLQGWTSPLAAKYGVSALPASFLLDPDGRIIAKNLRGHTLDQKLSELGLL